MGRFPAQGRVEPAVTQSVRSAVRSALERMLPNRQLSSVLDLNGAAREFGAHDVLYGARTDGLTLWDERGATVHLALARSDGRRRATLAHECGHLLMDPIVRSVPFLNAPSSIQARYFEVLEDTLGGPAVRALRKFDLDLGHERLCDLFGNELILPEELVRSAGENWDGSIAQLREMSSQLRVSLSALIIALNRIGFRRTFFAFRRTALSDWLAVRVVAAPYSLQGRVTCPTFQSAGLTHIRSWQGEVVIEMVTRSGTLRTPASVRLTSENALVICETARLDRQLRTRAEESSEALAEESSQTSGSWKKRSTA